MADSTWRQANIQYNKHGFLDVGISRFINFHVTNKNYYTTKNATAFFKDLNTHEI